MIPARLAVMTLLLTTSAGIAQGRDQSASLLQACLDAARDADMICSKLKDPAQWIECFDRATHEETQCLERALPGAGAKATATEGDGDGDARPREAPSKAATAAPAQPTPKELRPDASDDPHEAGLAQDNVQHDPQAGAQIVPAQPGSASSAREPSTNSAIADAPADTASTEVGTQSAAQSSPRADIQNLHSPGQSDDQPKEPLEDTTKEAVTAPARNDSPIDTGTAQGIAKPSSQSPATEAVERPAARQAPVVGERNEQAREPGKDLANGMAKTAPGTPATVGALVPAKQQVQSWLVSEMPSPIDYRPLLTAVLFPISRSEGGPESLNIRCIGGQTALSIRTETTWRASRKNALLVDHQINKQSTARQIWILSADAKSATYGGDPIALLRPLQEGARLTLSVLERTNARHEATFLLTGWDAARKRIGMACKWPEANAQASSEQR